MSAIQTHEAILSPEEYLAGELLSDIRHEYLGGRVYGMAGASVRHNQIATNMLIEFGAHLRGKKCQAFNSDMKVHLHDKEDDWFYYPDMMVSCDSEGLQKYYCDTPCLIVEVLSPETERTDRREKWLSYQRLESLHTYILADQMKREVTVYRLMPDGWRKTILTGDTTLEVPELEFSIPLDAIYARTGL